MNTGLSSGGESQGKAGVSLVFKQFQATAMVLCNGAAEAQSQSRALASLFRGEERLHDPRPYLQRNDGATVNYGKDDKFSSALDFQPDPFLAGPVHDGVKRVGEKVEQSL